MFGGVAFPVTSSVRRILVSLLLVAFPLASVVAQEDQSHQVKQILKLESDWNDAHLRGDEEALDRLWAEELTVVVPEMPLFTKPELLEMWKSIKVTFSRYQTTDVQVHFAGQTAVVTGRLQRSRNFGGQVRDDDWLFTKTYALVKEEWKVVSYHASNRPATTQ